jgi:hypothetical protein
MSRILSDTKGLEVLTGAMMSWMTPLVKAGDIVPGSSTGPASSTLLSRQRNRHVEHFAARRAETISFPGYSPLQIGMI